MADPGRRDATSRPLRSLLFAPAVRADLVRKTPRSRPDGVVIDLEDAVPAAAKEQARGAARALADELADPGGLAVYIRVNGVASPWFADDVRDALTPKLAGVVVPKLASAADRETVARELAAAGHGGLDVVAGVETAAGVLNVTHVLAPPVSACYFGAEDFIADMGGRRTAAGVEVLYARSRVALAARVAGVMALDQVVVDFRDEAAFIADAQAGRDLGYQGKLCIHPSQVPLANRVFSPAPEEVERCRRLLAAYETAAARGVAAIDFEGQLVDEPMARLARAIVAAAERLG